MANIYHRIRALFKRKRRLGLKDIPTLPADILGRIHAEAGLLRAVDVEVRDLREGEEPAAPRAVDPIFEAQLAAQEEKRKQALAADIAAQASSLP